MKKRNKIFTKVLSIVLVCVMLVSSLGAYSGGLPSDNSILFITESELESEIEYADVAILSEIDTMIFEKYTSIILPYSSYNVEVYREIYASGKDVYLYGEVSMYEYMELFQIEDIKIEKDVQGKNFKQVFSEKYKNEKQTLIHYRDSSYKSMACSGQLWLPAQNYISIVMNNQNKIQSCSTIVDQDFDIMVTGDRGYVVMDYVLYRNTDEQSEEHDYFAVILNSQTYKYNKNVKISGAQRSVKINNGQYLESSPEEDTVNGSLNFQIGYGVGGPTGSITYSMNLGYARINKTENLVREEVEWESYPRSGSFEDKVFRTSVSWANEVDVSKIEQAIDVDVMFGGRVNFGPSTQYPEYIEKTTNISFIYE